MLKSTDMATLFFPLLYFSIASFTTHRYVESLWLTNKGHALHVNHQS